MTKTIDFGQPGTMHTWTTQGLAYFVHEDGAVEQVRLDAASPSARKRYIYFSTQRFVEGLCLGDACFMCGVEPAGVLFNNEHVLPKWVLKRFGLFGQKLTLSNGTSLVYGRNTIPCCADCNALLGRAAEEPVRDHVDSIAHLLQSEQPLSQPAQLWLLFQWLCLIFVKTHLKDRDIPWHRDTRRGGGSIASEHNWEMLHHVHCIARTFYTNARVEQRVMGSMFVVAIKPDDRDPFDFVDLTEARTIYIRLGALAMIAVLDDCGAVSGQIYHNILSRVTGGLSAVQVRELLAHIAHANLHLLTRPKFYSRLDAEGRYIITVELPPQREFATYDREAYKMLFLKCCGDVIHAQPNAAHLLEAVERGTCSFIFGDDNEFIAN